MKIFHTMTNIQWYRNGKNICSRLRSRGYPITFEQKFEHLTFYYNKTFLFSGDIDIIGEVQMEQIITEIIKENYNVCLHS